MQTEAFCPCNVQLTELGCSSIELKDPKKVKKKCCKKYKKKGKKNCKSCPKLLIN